MGCDIHMYVEIFKNGKWVHAQLVDEKGDVPFADQVYSGRDYALFGMLAGVRDYENQVFEAKGLPDDLSLIVKKLAVAWGSDAHNHSYLTLAEIDAVNWDKKKVSISGFMKSEQKDKLYASIASGSPNWDLIYPHCGGTNIPDYVYFEVLVPALEYYDVFFKEVIPRLRKYNTGYEENAKNTRIVFWFDN